MFKGQQVGCVTYWDKYILHLLLLTCCISALYTGFKKQKSLTKAYHFYEFIQSLGILLVTYEGLDKV